MASQSRSHEDRLKTLFKYFVDVVRINIFITTRTGQALVTTEPNLYGWKLLSSTADIALKFKQSGDFLKYVDPYQLHHFAIPIRSQGYVVLGPLIINRKLERAHYREIALKQQRDPDDILDSVEDIRVLSQNQLQSILDLLAEAKDFFIPADQFNETTIKETPTPEQNSALKSLLESALRLTRAQSGSIMLYNEPEGLSVKVFKGISPEYINHKPLRLGEGISGYALQKNQTFILTDKAEDTQLRHLLKRKEIKQSIVMPFEIQEKNIRGVMNLNIQDAKSLIKGTDRIVKDLTKATMIALQVL